MTVLTQLSDTLRDKLDSGYVTSYLAENEDSFIIEMRSGITYPCGVYYYRFKLDRWTLVSSNQYDLLRATKSKIEYGKNKIIAAIYDHGNGD